MRADKIQMSWDSEKHNWLVRLEAGTEVIRRHCKQPRDANDETLRALAQQTAVDEGYEVDQSLISVVR